VVVLLDIRILFLVYNKIDVCIHMQEKAILETRPVLRKAIEEVYASISATASPRTLVVADLGCASGPNTLCFVLEMMSMIRTCSSKPEDAALPRRCSSS
jgi:hypothetical protein